MAGVFRGGVLSLAVLLCFLIGQAQSQGDLEELDVVIAVHVSHNVKIADVKKKLLPFVNDMASLMDIESGAVRVSFVVFGKDANVQFDLKQMKKSKKFLKAVKKALKPKTVRSKGADIVKVLNLIQTDVLVQDKGDRPDVPNLLIILTDSASNSQITDIIQESAGMKRAGTTIFAAGVKDADTNEIQALASDPVSDYAYVGKTYDDYAKSVELRERLSKINIFANLKAPKSDKSDKTPKPPKSTKKPKTTKLPDITTKAPLTTTTLHQRTTQEPSPTTTVPSEVSSTTQQKIITQPATTTVQTDTEDAVSITTVPLRSDTTITTMTTPYVIPLSGAEQADIVIAVHVSPEASQFDFGSLQQFLKTLIEDANVENGDVQLGLLFYAADPQVIFHINHYDDIEKMKKEIDGLRPQTSSRTDASGALNLGRQMLSDYFDRRNDVPAALIFITDAQSNENVNLLAESKKRVVDEGIQIFAVGVEMNDTKELDVLATSPYNVMMVNRYGQLRSAAVLLQNKILALAKKEEVTTEVQPQTTQTTTITTTTEPSTTTIPASYSTLGPSLIAKPECSLGNSDLVLVIDASTSVTQQNFDKQLEFAKDILRNADIDSGAVRVGALIYSTEVQIEFYLDKFSTKADVFEAIDNIPYIYGSTNTADALLTMANDMFTSRNGDRPDVPNTCIVITDGVSNINSRQTIPYARDARAKGIHIYAVGIGLRDTRELDGIASEPASENSFNVQNFEELRGLDKKIFSALCPVKPVITTPRPGKQCGLSKVDVVIILDASTSVTEGNFEKMRQFARDIVDKADVDSGSVRIGALIYSTSVEVQFYLNQYSTNAEIKAAIDKIPYIYGSTNSADALKTMHNQLFIGRNGDRPDVENIAFMITDGVSNINSRRTIPEAEEAMKKGIKVYAIGIGLQDTRELEGMASKPVNEHMFNVKEFDELTGLVDTIFSSGEACVSEPPVADAGNDLSIKMPQDFATLDGSRSTDDVKVVRYQWQQKSGPSANMAGQDNVELNLYGLRVGRYVFSLTVFDADNQSNVDDVVVVVEESGPPLADAGNDVEIQMPKDFVVLDGSRSTDDVAVVRYHWDQKSGGDVKMQGQENAELNLNGLQVGEYTFTLTVFDEEGQSDTDDVRVTVKESAPPVADAGRDVVIQMPKDSVTLDGSKSADDVAVVKYQWEQESGGDIKMQGLDSAALNLNGLQVGDYVFTLTVFDEDGQSDKDDVRVTVKESTPPVANAGSDVEIQMPKDSVTLDGSKSADDVAVVKYQWEQKSGRDVKMQGQDNAELNLNGLRVGDYVFTLTVFDEDGQSDSDDVRITVQESQPPIANAGDDVTIKMPLDFVTLDGTMSTDDVEVVGYQWVQKSGKDANMRGRENAILDLQGLDVGEYVFTLRVFDADGQTDEDDVTVRVRESDPPVANAGNDVSIQLPRNSVTLDGSKSFDDVTVERYQWTQLSGGEVATVGQNDAVLEVSNLDVGEYEFQLQVYDADGQTDRDTVKVRVAAADKPPVARAGDDATLQLPVNYVNLDGSRSSDDVRIVRYRWRLRSGNESSLKMDGERSPVLRLSELKPGNYRFSLTVVDEQRQKDTDYVEVNVLPDKPPTANAGEDQILELPVDQATLYGDRSTDDVRIVTYDWKQVSGGSVYMDGEDQPNVALYNLRAGEYTFELTVTDESGNQDTDTVTLLVLPEPTTPAPTEAPCGLDKTDVVFVVDASTSVTEANFKKQLDFMKSIINFADVDSGSVRFGALIYSTEVEIQFHLNDYRTKKAVLAAVDEIPYIYGSTNTADGLTVMRDTMFSFRNGDRDDAPNVAIVITDGVSNINSRRTISDAEQAKDVGIHIYAVGIGLTDTRELDAIASEPASENSFNVADFDELSGLGAKIFTATCVEKTTTTTMTTTTTITTTTTTAAPTTSPSCGLSKTDLIFILDASTSVTEENFQKMRDFLKDFLKNADINSGSVRVGVNIYSTDVRVMFHLNDHTTEAAVMNAIDTIPYIYGSTNTADAIKVMRDDMFTSVRGDRPDAPNICVLLTDGISNINSRRTIPEAEEARKRGIRIYVIGIGLTDTREVEGIASLPIAQNLYAVQDFDELVGLEQKMFKSVCPEKEEDEPPVANAGKDLTLQLPDDIAILSGERSTDDKAIIQYNWDQISGPVVRVTQTDDPNLRLTDLKEGSYEFELTVYDAKGQSDTDRVVVNVLPEIDLPPRSNAGSDVTIQLPNDTVNLDCAGSTDDKGIVQYEWKLTSGRGSSIKYRGEDSCNFEVSNLDEGTYDFTLTVRDRKGQSDTDTVRVTVLPRRDEPPVANAGRDYQIQLPTDTVTLSGSRSTDDIGITSYQWNVLSGDMRGVDLSGDNSETLQLDDLNEGEYVVRLTVRDQAGQFDTDEARIVVKPAPPRTSGYDVIFILDSSVSPREFRWMNDYARDVIREMSIDDGEFRVGYLIYSNNAYRQFDLDSYEKKEDVLAAVDKVGYRPGSKNTAAAFKYARYRMFTPENGDRDFAQNYIIHLSGGARSNDPFSSATEACGLQNNGVGMFAVGFGEVSDTSELHASSSLPTAEYEIFVRAENDIGEKPGLMLHQLKNGSPKPSTCPEEPTTPAPTGECKATGDIVFILDSSGSVGQDNFYRVLNFTYDTLDSLDVDGGRFRVGVTTFSDTSRLDFNLNEFTSKAEMKKALQEVVYMYGNTHTAHALRRARLEMFTLAAGDRPDVPNVVVIITDGQSNVNHELTLPEARALKAAGVSIITVAVGFTSETSELVGLTSPPVSENLIYVEDYKGLTRLKQKLIEPLCSDSNMCRNKPCQNGGECMDGIRSFVCICQEDFFGDTCNKRCGEPADVVLVLDSSNTVGEYNFGRLKEYAEHLVREMNKDACDINIGFLKYSSAAMVQVGLGTYTDTETNVRALEQISYSRGRANMAAAFRALRTEMFNGRNGDRSGARNIAYFLTDGTNDVNADMAEPEAELTISSGVRIIPIGINLRERFEIDNIAGNQGISVIEISDEPALIENTDSILRPLYEGNDFCAEDPCDNGGACFNEPFGFRCDCPIGYTGETCQRRCTARGDVVFAVDTSRYVTRSELKKVRRFLRSVVRRMRFKNEEFSVGMVQFTDWAKVTLDFDTGKSKKAVRSSIAGLRVHGGDPEPATALAKANYRIFNGRGEDRDKPDYLVLVTKSMRNELKVLDEANKLKIHGTRVLGVGIGLTEDEREFMESTVSMPYSQTAMFADDAKQLVDIADRVVEYMCDDEDLCAENPCRNGGVCRLLGGDYYCECGIGYAGKYCENRCQARADVVFLLDSSGSVGHVDFRRVKQFVHNLVSDLQIGRDKTRVGLVTYSSSSRHGFYMSKYYNLYELQNAVAGISYEYGDTNTASGLRLVRERYFGGANGDREEIQNFLVVVTDGVSNINPDQTIVEANLLKEQGVHIYAVGVGQFDPYEINSIASPPASQNAFILKDYTALSNISSSIVKKTCRDPTVCDENPCRNGGLCVPGINGPFCECRAGYRGEFCQDSCVTVKDVYFLMDSSDSIGQQNFQTALNFIASVTEEFSGEGSYNRFSLITFSDEVQIVFSLGRYSRLPILLNAIRFARYRPGNTNTAGAFRTVSEIAVDALGDRYDAENIIFLITDGNGNVDESTTVKEAERLKDKGARIIPIAVNMEDYSEIEQIASNRNEIFKVNDFSSLQSILENLVVMTCKNGNEVNGGK